MIGPEGFRLANYQLDTHMALPLDFVFTRPITQNVNNTGQPKAWVAVPNDDDTSETWTFERPTGRRVEPTVTVTSLVSLTGNPDGRRFAMATATGVQVFDGETGVQVFDGETGVSVARIDNRPDLRGVYFVSNDVHAVSSLGGDLTLHDADTLQILRTLNGSRGFVQDVQSTVDGLYGVDARVIPARMRQMLEMVDLWDRRDQPVQTYSGGMRRRLEIARGLMHSPQVLFLDEPTIGLDPQTRSAIWRYLRALQQAEGTTIFMTTHYMDEAEFCDRIAIMDRGEIVVLDTPEALKASVGADRVVLGTADSAATLAALNDRFGIEATVAEGAVTFQVASGEAFVPRLFAELDVGITSVTVSRPTLDDVFMRYTGSTIRDAETASTTNLHRETIRAFSKAIR